MTQSRGVHKLMAAAERQLKKVNATWDFASGKRCGEQFTFGRHCGIGNCQWFRLTANWHAPGRAAAAGSELIKYWICHTFGFLDIYVHSQLRYVSLVCTLPLPLPDIPLSNLSVCFSKLITSLKRSTHGKLPVCPAALPAFTLILFTQKNILWKLENSFCLPAQARPGPGNNQEPLLLTCFSISGHALFLFAQLLLLMVLLLPLLLLLMPWLLSCLGHCFTGAFGLFLPLFVGAATTTIPAAVAAAKIYKNNCHDWQPFGALLSFT